MSTDFLNSLKETYKDDKQSDNNKQINHILIFLVSVIFIADIAQFTIFYTWNIKNQALFETQSDNLNTIKLICIKQLHTF